MINRDRSLKGRFLALFEPGLNNIIIPFLFSFFLVLEKI